MVYFGGFFAKLGHFAGFSLYIKLIINFLIKFKKLRDIFEGPWLQKDIITINVPLFKKLRDIIFFCGTITL